MFKFKANSEVLFEGDVTKLVENLNASAEDTIYPRMMGEHKKRGNGEEFLVNINVRGSIYTIYFGDNGVYSRKGKWNYSEAEIKIADSKVVMYVRPRTGVIAFYCFFCVICFMMILGSLADELPFAILPTVMLLFATRHFFFGTKPFKRRVREIIYDLGEREVTMAQS